MRIGLNVRILSGELAGYAGTISAFAGSAVIVRTMGRELVKSRDEIKQETYTDREMNSGPRICSRCNGSGRGRCLGGQWCGRCGGTGEV